MSRYNPLLTDKCVEYISAHYHEQTIDKTVSEIKRLFGIDVCRRTVTRKARELGVHTNQPGFRWPKGETPPHLHPKDPGGYWRGKKKKDLMSDESIRKSNANMIPGNNRMPIGSETIMCGEVYVKVGEPYVKNWRKGWMRKDRYVWEKAYGRTDKDRVIHINGDRLDCSLENLIFLDRSEYETVKKFGCIDKGRELIEACIGYCQLIKELKSCFDVKQTHEIFGRRIMGRLKSLDIEKNIELEEKTE